MSLVTDIIARLGEPGTPFGAVAGAADFAAIEQGALATPTAYVLIAEEAFADNERMTGDVLQRTETDLAVIYVLDNLADVAMGAAAADLETVKAWARGKIIGFVPTGADEPITIVSGKLLKARHGTVWFEDVFAVPSYLEQSP